MSDELLRQLLDEVRALRADLQLRRDEDDVLQGDLVAALAGYFGSGTFTSTTVIMAAEEPGSEIAEALSRLIDMNNPSAIAVGRLLAKLPQLEPAGDRRGSRMFKVRGYPR